MNSLVRVNSAPGTEPNVSVLSYPPLNPLDHSFNVKFNKNKPESSPYGTYCILPLSEPPGTGIVKKIFEMQDIHVKNSDTGVNIPVLRFTEPSKYIYGTAHLHRNFAISTFEVAPAPAPAAVTSLSAPAVSPVPAVSPIPMFDVSSNFIAPYNVNTSAPSAVFSDASGNAITHVTNPVISNALNAKKKKIKPLSSTGGTGAAPASATAPAKPKGDLSPFVAKQLMELAKSKSEFCPIVAEEFSTGNTAVMPCGHLFAQVAIEESFKKELYKCPACRQPGRPTYV